MNNFHHYNDPSDLEYSKVKINQFGNSIKKIQKIGRVRV